MKDFARFSIALLLLGQWVALAIERAFRFSCAERRGESARLDQSHHETSPERADLRPVLVMKIDH